MELTYGPALADQTAEIFRLARELIEIYEDPALVDLPQALAWTRRKIESHIDQYTCVRVDGTVAGYFRLCPGEGAMELDDFYILPQFRGRGIGTQVLRRCMGCGQPIELYVFTQNTGALELYRRLGFEMKHPVSPTRLYLRREVL